MHNKGEDDVQVPQTSAERTALVPQRKIDFSRFVPKSSPEPTNLATDLRRVRRGKFFLSNFDQQRHGSMRRPIFQYWGHGVVVGETTEDPAADGVWCFGAHNDFDLVPEFMKPSDWPEYERTETGWIRKDGHRRISEEGTFSNALPDAHLKTTSLDDLLKLTSTLKRLK